MRHGAAVSASFLAALEHPAVWALTLCAFLIRGGLVLVVAPIIVIPSAVGLANILGPTVTSVALGGLRPDVVVLFATLVGGAFAWLLIGGWAAGVLEAEAVHRIWAEEAAEDPRRVGMSERAMTPVHAAGNILAARLAASLPLAIMVAAGSVRLLEITYRELTLPSETGPSLIVRVIRGAPDALTWIVLAWLLAETLGALAARRVVLNGESGIPALARAVLDLLRRPVAVLALAVLPLAVLILVLVPSAIATSMTWDAIRSELAGQAEPLVASLLVLLFVALWVGQLMLIGMVTAWRSAGWTIEMAGTFGGVTDRRTGEWSLPTASGTLGDLRPRGADHDPR